LCDRHSRPTNGSTSPVIDTPEAVEYRFAQERSAQTKTCGDIIRQHRDEHAINWLTRAIKMAVETGHTDLVLQRFLRLEARSV